MNEPIPITPMFSYYSDLQFKGVGKEGKSTYQLRLDEAKRLLRGPAVLANMFRESLAQAEDYFDRHDKAFQPYSNRRRILMIVCLSRPALTLLLVVGVLAISSIAGAQAAAPTLDLTITPTHPYVDDNVRVAFTDTRSLPTGSEIDVILFGTGVCNLSVAAKIIKGPQSAGRRFNLRFRPSDQIVSSGIEWCQGKAKVRITESKNESFVRQLAQRTFRFRAKP